MRVPRLKNRRLTTRYEDELRLFRSRQAQLGMLVLVVAYVLAPIVIEDDFWLTVLNFGGIAAIGALGLNLLTGYTGQVSLGHAFFLGVGAYSAAWFGSQQGLPLFVWLPAAAVIGGLIGAVVGPFALRLRGNYLVIVTLGLVFIGLHVFQNWDSVTGGSRGTPVTAEVAVGGVDFNQLELFGRSFSVNQGYFYLIWFLVGVAALLAKNIVRTRPGRALQAVRDRDVAAEIIGVSMLRYKVGAFAISSAFAAVAGALQASFIGFVSPGTWDLLLSIRYIAIIIIGGLGTIFGSIIGAVALGAMPEIINRYSGDLPFVITGVGGDGLITVASLNQMIYGVLIVVFLVLEPHGMAALWLRLKAYFRTWPFSY